MSDVADGTLPSERGSFTDKPSLGDHHVELIQTLRNISTLSCKVLQERWADRTGVPAPPKLSAELLVLAISYQVQAEALGGLSAEERQALGIRANHLFVGGAQSGSHWDNQGAEADALPSISRRTPPRPIRRNIKPGTRLLREWQGRTHEVIADTDGCFIYAGEQYLSLSAIARQITGTRWSGPAFFGVQSPGQLAKANGGQASPSVQRQTDQGCSVHGTKL